MVKKKFLDRRRKGVRELHTSGEARDYKDAIAELLESLEVDFESHWSEDENDDYDGFMLSFDPPWNRIWYIIKNPFGGSDLELGLDYDFDISFGRSCWSFFPTAEGHRGFCDMIKAILTNTAASVSCIVEGEYKASGILVRELMDENDMRLLERIAERDYYRNSHDVDHTMRFMVSVPLKKELRKLRSKKGWAASYEFWDSKLNKTINFTEV
jgi:hypothetical protein